ncbi:MAG TPA: hypothetical protein VM010_04510 [Chitinophagaceae bacterium]|nr:hypothetical protein [Chitinophagaceae bacterium]
METTLQQSISTVYTPAASHSNLFNRFISWCAGQDTNRYGWLGFAIAAHGCVFTPLTMFAIIMSGNHIVFWFLAIIAIMMTLVSNLAAMPTKYTIPVFVLSLIIDAAIVVYCAMAGFDITSTYQ